MSIRFDYKLEPFQPRARKADEELVATVSQEVEKLIADQSKENWEFRHVETINVSATRGCVAQLLGARHSFTPVHLAVFRRPGGPGAGAREFSALALGALIVVGLDAALGPVREHIATLGSVTEHLEVISGVMWPVIHFSLFAWAAGLVGFVETTHLREQVARRRNLGPGGSDTLELWDSVLAIVTGVAFSLLGGIVDVDRLAPGAWLLLALVTLAWSFLAFQLGPRDTTQAERRRGRARDFFLFVAAMLVMSALFAVVLNASRETVALELFIWLAAGTAVVFVVRMKTSQRGF